jgi:hypothetical protein
MLPDKVVKLESGEEITLSQSFRRIALSYAVSVAVWMGFSLLLGWQYRIYDVANNVQAPLSEPLALAAVRGFTLAILSPPVFYFVRRYAVNGRRLLHRCALYLFGAAGFVALYSCIRFTLLQPWDFVLQRFVPRTFHSLVDLVRTGFADQITMYAAIVVAAHAYEYFERVRRQELERYELQRALAASELQALKIQLHPHFLFNTLHGISTLIDGDGKSAKAMIIKLSSLLRSALEHGSSDLITLREELKFIQAYLDLESMRLGSRLSVSWSISPETNAMLVPQLILQPLVENAILHGISCRREGGWIEIASFRTNHLLEIRISNSVGEKKSAGMGLGQKNTQARLKHLYSEEAVFSFAIGKQTATARVAVPALGSHQQGERKSFALS